MQPVCYVDEEKDENENIRNFIHLFCNFQIKTE